MSLSLSRVLCFASFIGLALVVSSAATQQHPAANSGEPAAAEQVDLWSTVDDTMFLDADDLVSLLRSNRSARSTVADDGRLNEVEFTDDKCDDTAVAPLRGSPHLEVVRLSSPKITDASLAVLATCRELTYVGLKSAAVTDAGLGRLARLKKLTGLSLSHTNIGDSGLQRLGELPNLETLELDTTQVGDRGLESLTRFPKLSRLSVGRWRPMREIRRDGFTYHVQLAHTEGSNEPSLITDRGIEKISQLAHLRSLGLMGAKITDEGVRPLTRLADLTSLDLSYTTLTGTGLAHLAQLKNLGWLDLSYTHIRDEDLPLLLQLPKLTFVGLNGTTISSAGLDELYRHPKLQDLGLNSSRVGQKGYQAWQARSRAMTERNPMNSELRATIFGDERGGEIQRGDLLRKLSDGDAAPFLARLDDDDLLVDHRLVEHGFGYPQFNGATALHFFVERDDLVTVSRLLRRGASLSLRDNRRFTPLHYARSTAMAELLLDHGAEVQPKKRSFPSALDHAPNAEVAEIYLRHGADLKRVDDQGLTALHYAASAGRLDVVKLLIERGADVRADASATRAPVDDTWGWGPELIMHVRQSDTPLSWAVSSNRAEVAEYLVQHGADCAYSRADGTNLIDLAAWSGSPRMNRLVMVWCAKLSPPRVPTDRHLLAAVRSGRDPEVVRMFLDAGADVNCRYFVEPPKEGIARIRTIRNDNGSETEPDFRNWTPLHFAADDGKEDLVQLLLERGADVQAKGGTGVTPIDCARRVEQHVPSPWFVRNRTPDDGFPTAVDTARERRNAARVAIHELLTTVAAKTGNESASR